MTSGWLSVDPLKFQRELWPAVRFYKQQEEIIRSVEENDETYVVAGNQLGKDYVAGYVCLSVFLRSILEGKTCRIITTSVAEHHLSVLWGEINRFVSSCRAPLVFHPLTNPKGPLVLNHMRITRSAEVVEGGKDPLNYLVGRVSEKGEGLAGHHGEITLFVGDEASGLAEVAYKMAQGWAKRMLIFGNPNDCDNFFRQGVEAGDLLVA